MIRRDRDALQRDQRLDPFGRPGAVAVGREFGKRAEGESALPLLLAADLVVIAAGGKRQRQSELPLSKAKICARS
jgi:hypothetical protein